MNGQLLRDNYFIFGKGCRIIITLSLLAKQQSHPLYYEQEAQVAYAGPLLLVNAPGEEQLYWRSYVL